VKAFRAAMHAIGLNYGGPIIADGKLHRFKADGDGEKNSWYVLHSDPPVAGAFGCWKRAMKETWCERNGQLSQREWDQVRRRWQDSEGECERTEAERHAKARKIAGRILTWSKPADGSHSYLVRKGVGPHGELTQRGDLWLCLCATSPVSFYPCNSSRRTNDSATTARSGTKHSW